MDLARLWKNSTKNIETVFPGLLYRRGMKNCDFRKWSRFILETIQDRATVTMERHKRNRMWSIYNAWHFQWHWMTENSDYLTLNIPETVQERHYIRPILKRFNFECSWAISSSLANFQRHRVSRDLFATAELLVTITFHFITALIPWIFENCK